MSRFFLLIRSILFFIGQSITTPIFFVGGLLLFPFPYIVRYRFITGWSHYVIWLAKVVCGINFRVHGLENLPEKNAIVLCKHQSAWETLFLQKLLPPQCWVLKRELLWIPFFGWGLYLLEPIAIDRKSKGSFKQLVAQGKKRLSQGRWIIIFPEGTRTAVGQSGRYARSGAFLAKESGFPIVPIAHNAGVFWPRKAFIKRPGTIEVVIGPTIDPAYLTAEEIHEKAKDWIEETVKTLPIK